MGKHTVTATIYDRSGNVLSKQSNNYGKSHPLQAKFAVMVGQPERIYLHAEIAAIAKLKKEDVPYKIKVERYTKDDRPALAKPCPVCQAAIKHWGIRCIEYTL